MGEGLTDAVRTKEGVCGSAEILQAVKTKTEEPHSTECSSQSVVPGSAAQNPRHVLEMHFTTLSNSTAGLLQHRFFGWGPNICVLVSIWVILQGIKYAVMTYLLYKLKAPEVRGVTSF
jgi:hypothetical protein